MKKQEKLTTFIYSVMVYTETTIESTLQLGYIGFVVELDAWSSEREGVGGRSLPLTLCAIL